MSTPTYQSFIERPAYRAALILNNFGVRLLERHCYNQALLTLRDALTLLPLGVDSVNSITCCCEDVVAKHAGERIRLAMSRLAAPEPHEGVMGLRMLDTDSLSKGSSAAPSPDVATIIYIQELDLCQLSSADQDPAVFATSILMQNFAVVYQCLSRLLLSDTDRRGFLHGARDLQNASSKLLRNHRDDCADYLRMSSLLHLEVIILSSSVALLDEMQEEQEAKQLYKELQDLVEWVAAGASFWKCMEPKSMTAGAA